MATEVGTAYVSLQADTRDVEKSVKKSLDNSVKEADKAGKEIGAKLSKNVTGSMSKTGKDAGAAFDKAFGTKVQGAGKNAIAGLGQMMMGGAEGIGSNVGGGIMGSLVGALNQGASKAISALEGVGIKGGAGMSSKLVAAGTVAAGGVALIGAAAVAVGKQLYDLGSQWDGIADGIVFKTGKVGEELDKITGSIKKVGLESFAPLGDIGDVATGLVKGLNLSGAGLEKLTNQIANYNSMAKDAGVEPLNLTEFMKAMKRFKMEGDVDGMSQMLDHLFNVSQETTIPLNTLVTTLKTMGTQARDFKLPMESVVQILAEFDNAGLDASMAMTGFRTAMNKLATEADPAGALRQQVATIEELANKTDESSQAKAREMAQTLFGNRAWQVYFDAIRDGKIDIDNLTVSTQQTGQTINETREQTADFSEEWQNFKNFLTVELEPVATAVFGGINKYLQDMVRNVKDFVGWFKDPSWEKFVGVINTVSGLLSGGAGFAGGLVGQLFGNDAKGGGGGSGGGGAKRSSAGLMPNARNLQEQIASAFPAVKDIGGFRANDPYPDHPSGRAIDVMIPPELVGTPMGKLLGDSINKYALQSGMAQYTMWGQQQYMGDGSVKGMEDRGSPTQNHMDHVHIYTRLYDTGGWLPPGITMVKNATGEDELILNPEQQKMLADQGIDPNALLAGQAHGTSGGAAPGPDMATSNRTEGFVPVAASGGGVPGTSMFSAFLNMGAEATNGAIDAAAQAAQLAVSAGAAAGTMGAGAAAGPAASMGIQMGSAMAKRGVSYGFQMAGIVGDALIEQLFPFGAPRWIGYDYTAFAPQTAGTPAGITTGERATNAAAGLPGDPAAPVNTETMPGAAQPITTEPRPDPMVAPVSNLEVNNLQAQSTPPLVNIGNIYGHSASDVAGQIEAKQRLAMMQYAGRP